MRPIQVSAIVACAAWSLSIAACGGSKESKTAASPMAAQRSFAGMCAAQIPGVQVSAVDTEGGIRVNFSAPAGNIEPLRHSLQDLVSPSSARAAGGSPQPGAVMLPPADVQMTTAPAGAFVDYRAKDPNHAPRVRQLVHWDVKRMQLGYCSALRSPPESSARASGGQPEAVTQTVTGVALDPPLVRECGVSSNRAFFEFDSANVRPRAHPMLDTLSECLTEGKLAGRKIRITGRADPRGTDEYNMALGYSRAQAIANYLSQAGMAVSNMEVISTGEQEATGTDEFGWSWDRRVDIRLIP